MEKVYENGRAHRLQKQSLTVEQQTAIQVTDEDGTILGNFIDDLYVENRLIVELKVCKALAGEHIAQVLGYLRASGKKHGHFINFGAPVFEIKKLIL